MPSALQPTGMPSSTAGGVDPASSGDCKGGDMVGAGELGVTKGLLLAISGGSGAGNSASF